MTWATSLPVTMALSDCPHIPALTLWQFQIQGGGTEYDAGDFVNRRA